MKQSNHQENDQISFEDIRKKEKAAVVIQNCNFFINFIIIFSYFSSLF